MLIKVKTEQHIVHSCNNKLKSGGETYETIVY